MKRKSIPGKKKVQVPFNISDQLLGRLMQVGDRMWRDTDKQCTRWNLTANHYNVLRILNGAGEPLSQVEISRRLLSSRANVTKLVDYLESQQMVRRMSCKDRRVNMVELTPRAFTFLENTIDESMRYTEREMKGLSKQNQEVVFRLLGRLV